MSARGVRAWRRRHGVRLRLTALYGVLFLACGAGLLTITYVLVQHGTSGQVVTFSKGDLRGMAMWTNGAKPAGRQQQSVHIGAGPAPVQSDKIMREAEQTLKAQTQRQHQAMMSQLLVDSGIALGLMALLSCGLGWVVAGRTLRPLETSLEAQRRFVANASHELRTPLARQRAIGQVALADPEADVRSLRAAHERVLAAGAHQERLITGLLALARGQAGIDHTESLDLGRVAARALAARQAEADLRGVVVETDVGDAPIEADPRLVDSLAGNLIENALRHNVPDGWVLVSTALRDGRAVLSVRNSGPEVPPDAVPGLLEPFRRLGAERVSSDGAGIGLSIVRAVCEAHRADLTVEARPGGGLDVTVAFAAAPLRDAGAASPGRSRSVLIT